MFLIGFLFLSLCSIAIILAPMFVGAKSENIKQDFFKVIRVGKCSFLFGNSRLYPIKKTGIIIPYFIMQIVSYTIVALAWGGCITCLILCDENTVKELSPILFGGGGCVIAIIAIFLISEIASIISKKRSKKLENKKYKSFLDR